MRIFGVKRHSEDRLRANLNLLYVCDRNGSCAAKPCVLSSSLFDLSSLDLGHSLRGKGGGGSKIDIYSSDLDFN